jgi:hypothetical protein
MCRRLIYLISFAVLLIAASSVQALIEITTAVGGGADTTLSNDADKGPTVVHGALGTVRLRDYPGTRAKIGFIRFDLTGIAGDLTGATLSLNFTTAYAKTWNVYGLKDGANDLWPEATTNYNNAPGFIPNPPTTLGNWAFTDPPQTVLLGTFDIPAGAGYYTSSTTNLNLDTFLNSDTNKLVTLVIIGQGSGNANDNYFSTKESTTPGPSFAPKLTFSLSQLKANASGPSPADKATDVPHDVTLSWTPGQYVGALSPKHKIYFSDDFNNVNTSVGGVTQDPNYYPTVGALNLGFSKTYYWRVDEANSTTGWDRGNIWQFTVEPVSYQLPGSSIINATASSISQAGMEPNRTSNGSGLTGDLHSTLATAMWLSGDSPGGAWIQYAFDRPYKLHEMWVWNYNGEGLNALLGLKSVTVSYSTNGTNWMQLGGMTEFAIAPGSANYAHNTTINFGGVAAKYVKITANSNWSSGAFNKYGLSEVRFFYIPAHAREPSPTNGQTNVAPETVLRWKAGREAVTHKLYFSASEQAVRDGTITPVSIPYSGSACSYDPLSLELGKTYYWRVDEVNEAATPTTWQGDIWSFATIDHVLVDDFEDYNDSSPDIIWQTWIDSLGYTLPPPGVPGNGTGAIVGYGGSPYAETRAAYIHGGAQSMPLDYNDFKTPYYSETERTWDVPQDWTRKDVKALTLWFKGYPLGFIESPPGHFTIGAGGADIYGTADQFRYVFKPLSGDGTIIAKVISVSNSDPWAKAGVMIRETLAANSTFAAVYIAPGNGCRYQARLTTGGGATSDTAVTQLAHIRAPHWIKMERIGSIFNAYDSNDPATDPWHPLAWNPQTITMATDVYIGLALTSHNVNVMCEAEFSDVATTGSVTDPWQEQVIGTALMPDNFAEPLYVALKDSVNNFKVVTHPDPNAVQLNTWQEWNIDLKEFSNAGVDLMSIKKMYIGVGNRANPTPGNLGNRPEDNAIYVDDIRLYPRRCIPSMARPLGDFGNDCVVDYIDLDVMVGEWLTTVPPETSLAADLNADDKVDLKDYAVLAEHWLEMLLWP